MDIILTPDEQDSYDERLAIMVIDAHLPEWQAERLALDGILKKRPKQGELGINTPLDITDVARRR